MRVGNSQKRRASLKRLNKGNMKFNRERTMVKNETTDIAHSRNALLEYREMRNIGNVSLSRRNMVLGRSKAGVSLVLQPP